VEAFLDGSTSFFTSYFTTVLPRAGIVDAFLGKSLGFFTYYF